MRAFVDTANIEELKEAVAYGFFTGVTTNPMLIHKEAKPEEYKAHILRIREVFGGVIFAQVIGSTAEEMVRQAKEISSWTDQVVIKLPMNREGVKAVAKLSAETDIQTCMTVTFSATQAVVAAAAGATYVAPFFKRINGSTGSAEYMLKEVSDVLRAMKAETKIIGASIDGPMDVVAMAKAGADVITAPLSIWKKMIDNPLSDDVMEMFMNGWTGKEI